MTLWEPLSSTVLGLVVGLVPSLALVVWLHNRAVNRDLRAMRSESTEREARHRETLEQMAAQTQATLDRMATRKRYVCDIHGMESTTR